MTKTKTNYPARYVFGRIANGQAIVGVDEAELHSDVEAGIRLAGLHAIERVAPLGYTYILAPVADVERVVAEQKAKLQAQADDPIAALAEAEREYRQVLAERQGKDPILDSHDPPEQSEPEEAATSPGSEPSHEEPSDSHSTTGTGNGQGDDLSEFALTILYVGMAPRPTETSGATGKLVKVEMDGTEVEPPAHNIYECRQWARLQGYTVNYTLWRVTHKMNGRHGQVRREVYTRNGKPHLVDYGYLQDADSIATPPPVTDEMKARWLAEAEKAREAERARRRAMGDRGADDDRWTYDPWYNTGWTGDRLWNLPR